MSRENILMKCQENIETVRELTDNLLISEIIKIMAQPLKERIERIKSICEIDEYTLTFTMSLS